VSLQSLNQRGPGCDIAVTRLPNFGVTLRSLILHPTFECEFTVNILHATFLLSRSGPHQKQEAHAQRFATIQHTKYRTVKAGPALQTDAI
jgi:hypothetical protein